ncbi:hypothetical protein M5J06_04580 [Corynebacterium sp. B5-R-101]|uniref:Secreted protein n=1 Tax=Corynebacterium intestinale TaxID=2943492 RepID=A0ABT0T8T9_9CORY|nr:hypothetical protein [Corynebacterium intestinale]MCL8493410.1 hypothetical protein [Corynebacterium intestinale]MCP1389642.1 hypothetical protein [Corynebacterium intestinale]
MQKQQHRIAAMIVAGTLLASSGQFAVANATEKETEKAPATSTQGSSNLAHSTFKSETPEVQPYGFKGFIAKKSLQGISWLLRNTPEKFIERAGDALDDGARKKILQHSDEIADEIDEVAELPDLAHHIVKEKLTIALEPIVGTSYSLMIADVIAWLAL